MLETLHFYYFSHYCFNPLKPTTSYTMCFSDCLTFPLQHPANFQNFSGVSCTGPCRKKRSLLALIFLTTFFLPFMQLENKNNENYTL
jgi:hypothetical protein